VTFGGAPVENGTINFAPIAHTGRQASGVIAGGKYLIPEAQGPNEGKYRAEIYVFQPPPNAPPEGSDAGMVQVAPEKFNQKSELQLDVSGKKVEKNFDLTR
jgi:hypothetical protein